MSMKHIMGPNSTSSLSKVQPKDIQPNAVDLRLGKVFQILDKDFVIDEDQKVHRGSKEWPIWEDGYYHLTPGTEYPCITSAMFHSHSILPVAP